MTRFRRMTLATLFLVFFTIRWVGAAEWQSEWESALKGAKKEGKVVIAIPPSAELRKELEPLLKQKFGIEAELVVSRGADSANRIASEFKAGVRYFDMIHSRHNHRYVTPRRRDVRRCELLHDSS